jgi:predicted TIM-barrel fold metal-dependent hydrolase
MIHAVPAKTSADAWMISVDDHLIEPPNVWADRLPSRYRDRGPRWVVEDGVEAWHYEDVRQSVGGAVTSGAIWPPEDRPPVFNPLPFSEIPLACHDPKARLEAMDTDGVLASLLFPNLPGFAGSLFVRAKDKELALLCLQAYNDWVIDEWCATAPGRFIPLALVPMWDGTLAGAEAERVIDKGARAISFSMAPQNLGLPPIDDRGGFWDPLFSTVSSAGVPLCTHLGTGTGGRNVDEDERFAMMAKTMGADAAGAAVTAIDMASDPRVGGTLLQLAGQTTLVEWLYSGNFDRYPGLKVALSENGIGWIPAVLQSADWMLEMSRNRVTQPADPENDPLVSPEARELALASLQSKSTRARQERLPSEVFRDHVYGCFIHDPVGLKLLDELGVDNVMIETDFPHNSTWFPHSMSKAKESLAGFPDDVRRKILRGNAERVFSFTPSEPD